MTFLLSVNGHRRLLVMGVLIVALLVFAGPAFSKLIEDPRLRDCGAGTGSGNRVLSSFELAHARDFWTRFPEAGLAPELERDDPAFVVVFDGPATHMLALAPIFVTAAPADQAGEIASANVTRNNVVCVVTAGGPYMYSEVNLTGFTP